MTPCRVEPAAVSRITIYVPAYAERARHARSQSGNSWKLFQKGIWQKWISICFFVHHVIDLF